MNMMMPKTPFSWSHLNLWNIGFLPNVLLVAALVLYFVGLSKVREWPRYRKWFFLAGLAATFLATQSVVGVYDMSSFGDHMIQHLLLIMLAAPLFALGAPLELLHRAGGKRIEAIFQSRAVQVILHPLFAFVAYFVFIPVTHLTSLMNDMLSHMWLHHTEQIAFLVIGYLFFRSAFGIEEGVQINPGLRLVYVMAAVPVDTFTGLSLAMESHNPFPAYNGIASQSSILGSVHLGGAIMWIGGDALMLLSCIPIAIMWVRYETVKTKELDAILDAQGI